MPCLSARPIVFVFLLAVTSWQRLLVLEVMESIASEMPSTITSWQNNALQQGALVGTAAASKTRTGSSNSQHQQQHFDHEICILTMTAAHNHESRLCQRKTCRVDEYNNNNHATTTDMMVHHRFVVGMPSYSTDDPNSHEQGKVGTEREVMVATSLLQEQETFGDIVMIPHRDHYRDLSEKRLAILKYGIEHNCRYTFKTDDEYCMNMTIARELISAHEKEYPHDQELYIGTYMWQGTEYPDQMTGPHGERAAPYMSGAVNGVSNKLSSYIVGEDWTHSVLRFAYGTSSEDLNLGGWVDFAKSKHNVSVNYVVQQDLMYERALCNNQ